MPNEYILSHGRYDGPIDVPNWHDISDWFYWNVNVHAHVKVSSWTVLTNWKSTWVHAMPNEYILSHGRYDGPTDVPNWEEIPGWFYLKYRV
jgi:hypothetical protein